MRSVLIRKRISTLLMGLALAALAGLIPACAMEAGTIGGAAGSDQRSDTDGTNDADHGGDDASPRDDATATPSDDVTDDHDVATTEDAASDTSPEDTGPAPEDTGPAPDDTTPPPQDTTPPDDVPPASVCGNGQVENGEVCDDGNRVDVDLCNNTCTAARPAPGPLTPVFSVPSPTTEDSAMEDEVLRLFHMIAPGSEVRISIYEWSRTRFVGPLGDAVDQGADVRLVLDGGGSSQEVLDALNTRLGAGRIHRCVHADHTACIGDKINHNKFFLFSALTDGSRNVVVQSSANLNGGQVNRHNNLVIIRGDRALYDFYRAYWEDLNAERSNLDYYRSITGDGGTKAYFYPRASGDTILSVIDNIHCDAGATVRVAMAFFTDGRDEIATALAGKKRAGCDVRVIIGTYDDSPGTRVMAALNGANVPVFVAPDSAGNVHSKYMIIQARYGAGSTVEKLVFTGSHNYTGPALRRNDEALIRVADGAVYDAFLANWNAIRAQLR